MDNYGLIYQSTFNPIKSNVTYKIEILQKNYTGTASNVTCAGVIHGKDTDDPYSPIQGTYLTVTLINNGTIPLESFLSNDDTFFKVIFYEDSNVKFAGFIVQDDCSEIMVDFRHEIVINANDNLGLLKGVPLDRSPAYYQPVFTYSGSYSSTASNTLILPVDLANNILIGDKLNIIGSIFNVTYTVIDNSNSPSILVQETVSTGGPTTADFRVLRSSLLDKVTLSSLIGSCLQNTDLDLDIKVFGRLHETTQDLTECFLLQTLIDPQTFITGTSVIGTASGINANYLNYQDCYTVLSEILQRFRFILIQSNGVWNLVRWDDLLFYENLIPSYNFDKDFNYQGTESLPAAIEIDINNPPTLPDYYPETGYLNRVVRGLEFTKEVFNYKQPALLLRNADLSMLGALKKKYPVTVWITTDGVIHYTDPGLGGGPGTVETFQTWVEYVALWWSPSVLGMSVKGDYFIRVILDSFGNEVDRYMCVLGDCFSYKVEANLGDVFDYTYQFKTQASQPGTIILQVFISLYNGTTTNYLSSTGWVTVPGYAYEIPAGDNSNQWHTVDINSLGFPIPFDGVLNFYLRVADLSGIVTETQYKDIRLDYTPLVNGTTKITGHFHEALQTSVIKQNDNKEIFLDTSPRNSVAGTLFLNSLTGLLQKCAVKWQHTYLTESKNLGEITTVDELFWRIKTRYILEGAIRGITGVSMISTFTFTQKAGLNFVFGKTEIDYYNERFSGTIWEIWRTGEAQCATYIFGPSVFPVTAWSLSGKNCDGTDFAYSSISGTGGYPGPICAQKGSIVLTGNVVATESSVCGNFISSYIFNYLYNPI